jgi:hypothetical protein
VSGKEGANLLGVEAAESKLAGRMVNYYDAGDPHKLAPHGENSGHRNVNWL